MSKYDPVLLIFIVPIISYIVRDIAKTMFWVARAARESMRALDEFRGRQAKVRKRRR